MKREGIYYRLRGSNKKYPELDDLDKLFEALKTMCVEDYARKYGYPPQSVRWRLRYFKPEWLEQIVYKKVPHRKLKTMKKHEQEETG